MEKLHHSSLSLTLNGAVQMNTGIFCGSHREIVLSYPPHIGDHSQLPLAESGLALNSYKLDRIPENDMRRRKQKLEKIPAGVSPKHLPQV